jgi:hypothetical protein
LIFLLKLKLLISFFDFYYLNIFHHKYPTNGLDTSACSGHRSGIERIFTDQ